MSDDQGKVVRPKFGDPQIVIDSAPSRCAHQFVMLRSRDKRVFCRACDEEIDAFDLLFKLTREWQWATHHEREVAEATKALEELKREEANVRGRLRTAHKLAVPDARATVFFDEYMRKLNAANDDAELRAAHDWSNEFKWLDPQQYVALREATVRAERRAEDSRRRGSKRNRHIRVINGEKK